MKYTKPFDQSDPAAPYVNANPAAGVRGSKPPAEAIEHPQRELDSLILKSGLTPSGIDLLQVTKAVRSQRLNWVGTFGGGANALTCTLDPVPAALADLVGMPIRGVPAAANTGAATLAVNGLAATAITWPDGTALRANDLKSGSEVELIYDGTAFRLMTIYGPGLFGGGSGLAFDDLNVFVITSGDRNIPHATHTVVQFGSATIGANAHVSLQGGACRIDVAGRYQILASTTAVFGGARVSGSSGGLVFKNGALQDNLVTGAQTNTDQFENWSGLGVHVLDLVPNDWISTGVYQANSGAATRTVTIYGRLLISKVR